MLSFENRRCRGSWEHLYRVISDFLFKAGGGELDFKERFGAVSQRYTVASRNPAGCWVSDVCLLTGDSAPAALARWQASLLARWESALLFFRISFAGGVAFWDHEPYADSSAPASHSDEVCGSDWTSDSDIESTQSLGSFFI